MDLKDLFQAHASQLRGAVAAAGLLGEGEDGGFQAAQDFFGARRAVAGPNEIVDVLHIPQD